MSNIASATVELTGNAGPSEHPFIAQLLDEQSESLARLDMHLANLTHRLQPVSLSDSDMDAIRTSDPERPVSEVAGRIRSATQHIDRLSRAVAEAIDALEI